MNRNIFRAALALGVAAAAMANMANGQILGRAMQENWANARGDAQRSGWQRSDQTINLADVAGAKTNYSSPDKMSGFGLQLRKRMDNLARGGASLSAGVTLSGAGLGLNMGFINGSNNRTIGIDMDTGFAFYTHVYEAPAPVATLTCPGATTVAPARPGTLAIQIPPALPVAAQAAGGGRGTYTNFLSEPGAGVGKRRPAAAGPVALGDAAPAGAPGAPGAAAAPGRAGAAPAGAAAPGRAGAAPAAAGAPGAAPAGRAGGAGRGVAYGVAGALERGNGAGAGGGQGSTYTVSNDGKIHVLTNQYGKDAIEPLAFIPAGAQPTDLIAVDNVVYTSTVNSCRNTSNGVWAVTVSQLPRGPGSAAAAGRGGGGFGAAPAADAPPPPAAPPVGRVTSWTTGGTASPSAPAFLPNGTAIVTTSTGTGDFASSVVALNAPALTVKTSLKQAGVNFIGAPVIFPSARVAPAAPGGGGGRGGGGGGGAAAPAAAPAPAPVAAPSNVVAAQASDGRIFLFNEQLTTVLYSSPAVAGLNGYKPANLASWQDNSGQRWLLSTTATSVIAYKVAVTGNSATLTKGWELTGLKAPVAPIIVNGVVFAASSGEYVPAPGTTATQAARVKGSTRAVLYAVNGMTGEKLWNSGSTITSFIPRSGGIWSSMGQVLLGTYDNTFYAFGTNMERHGAGTIALGH